MTEAVAVLVSEYVRTAQRQHQCRSCRHWIYPGMEYARQFWLVENEKVIERLHLGCEEERRGA